MRAHWLTAFRRPFSTGPLSGPISSFVSACAAGLARTAISRNTPKGERDNIITKQKSGGSRDLLGEAHLGEMRGHAGGWPAIIWLWSCVSDKRNNWIFFFFYLPLWDLIWFHWGFKKRAVWKERRFTLLISRATSSENLLLSDKIAREILPWANCIVHVAATPGLHVRPTSDGLLRAGVFLQTDWSCALVMHEWTQTGGQWDQWQIHLL